MDKNQWYARSVFSVSNIEKSIHYYCISLGFAESWKYEEEGKNLVAQVTRNDFEIILTENLDRVGQGRIFVSLSELEFSRFKLMLKKNKVAFDEIHWGYPAIRLQDPDGNEMIFPREESN